MDFTIVLASRQRSQLLVHLMKSINETTSDLSKIEVIVGIDDDDAEMHDCKNHVTGWYNWVKFFSQPRSEWLNQDYLNKGANMGTGKYVIVLNDDVIFKTKDWDNIARAKFDDYLKDKPDGIFLATPADAVKDHFGISFSSFPIISRKAIETVGFAMPPNFRSWSCDIACFHMYNAVGRVLPLPEILLFHDCYHSGSRGRDATSYHVQNIADAGAGFESHIHVQKLKVKIAECKII